MSIESYPSPNGVLTSLIWRKTMSGGETSLSGYDNASQALSYTPGQEQVYLNGILLVRADDYTATNGTSITGLSALSASDYVQVNCYNNFSVASVPAASLTGTVTNAQLANSAITINGSAISLGGTVTLAGDIESVTATSPLTGGGSTGGLTVGIQEASTSQRGSVQLSDSTSTTSSVLAATPTAVKSAYDLANGAIPKTLTTTTGDIIYASGANTPARLGIGSSAQVLSVSGGVPTWATPAASGKGLTLLSTTTLSGASTTVSSIDQTYTDLRVVVLNYRPATNNTPLKINFNSDTTANHYMMFYQNGPGTGFNSSYGQIDYGNASGSAANYSMFSSQIFNYTNTSTYKLLYTNYVEIDFNATPIYYVGNSNGCVWNQYSSAINSITLAPVTGSFTSGTLLIYGV